MSSLKPSATTSKSTMTETSPWVQFAQPWQPHAGQKKGVKFFLEHACTAMFADPGCGKTSMVYAAFKILKKKGVANKMLVVAPLRPAYLVWPAEQKKWLDFKDLRVEVLHGPKKAEALARDADVYVINYEGLDWLLGATKSKTASGKTQVTVGLKRFKALGFDTLVLDELSKVKNPQSNRHKSLKQVIGTFGRRWGLTGSPAARSLMDLFGQVYILDMGRTFGPYITHFRTKYFVPAFNGFDWNLRKGAEKEIYERLKPLVCRLDAEDYIDMPELVSNKILFDLPPDIQEIYDRLEEDMIVRLGDEVVVAANAASAAIKVRQVVNGGIYLDPDIKKLLAQTQFGKKAKRDWTNLHTLKVDLLEDLVDELQGSPLLVAYDFQHDLDRLRSRFGQDVPYIGGGVSAKRAAKLERAWNKGEIPLLLGHPQSIGHGLNLQEAGNHVCWHSMTYDFELYDQFIRRVRRQGNRQQRVFVHHILARKTVDEVIYWMLQAKDRTQRGLLDAMKNVRRK